MAKYYFFDGEHAETFSAETNFKDVGNAIKNMLGSTIAQRAIDDLKAATKHFSGLMGQVPGEAELKEITKEVEALDAGITKAHELRADLLGQQEALEDQIAAILEKLRAAEGAKELQSQRDDKTRQLRLVQDRIDDATSAIVRWVGTKSLPLVARKLGAETLSFIDEQSLKGRIPSLTTKISCSLS